jgi:prophage regulatory protein
MQLVRYPQLATDFSIPYTRVHLARLERAGRFPIRIRLSENVIAWKRDEVESWLQARIQARNVGEVR